MFGGTTNQAPKHPKPKTVKTENQRRTDRKPNTKNQGAKSQNRKPKTEILRPKPLAFNSPEPPESFEPGQTLGDPKNRKTETETREPKPETRHSKPENQNLKLGTRRSNPEIRTPKPDTRNLKPDPQNLKLLPRSPHTRGWLRPWFQL